MHAILTIYPLIVYYLFLFSVYNFNSSIANFSVLIVLFIPVHLLIRKYKLNKTTVLLFLTISVISSLLLCICVYIDPFYPKIEFDSLTVTTMFLYFFSLYFVVLFVSLLYNTALSKLLHKRLDKAYHPGSDQRQD